MSARIAHSANDAYDYHTEIVKSVISPLRGDIDDRLRCIISDADAAKKPQSEQFAMIGQVFEVETVMLNKSQTIFVSGEIVDEILEAEKTLIDTAIIEQDLFTPAGLIVLEKPLKYELPVDDNEYIETWLVTSICYTTLDEQININIYGNLHSIREASGELVYSIDDDKNEYTYTKSIKEIPRSRICLADITVFGFGETTIAYDDALLQIKRFLIAFFRLTYEYLERHTEKPPRTSRRRAERENRPQDGYTVYMKLRRTLHDGDNGGTTSSPAYAFRVRGHWKRAYLRSRGFPVGDPRSYRHVYVKDYIKGRGDFIESKRLVKVEK
jgi:hypothetical protein